VKAIQPYQRGLPTFVPGHALTNMIAGRDAQGQNPQDLLRLILSGNPGALAQLVAARRRPVAPYPLPTTGANALPHR
jgi:hypothetical protein